MDEPRPQRPAQHFTPWTDDAARSCWSCAHATGYDGVHLWCLHFRIVVLQPCGLWRREPGSD